MAGTLANLLVKISVDRRALTKGLGKAKSDVKGLDTSIKKTVATSKRGTKDMGDGFADVGDTINNKTKAAVLALGVAIGVVAKQTFNVGRSFSAAIGDLAAITGATGEDLTFLSDKAKEFGQSTTQTATEVAQAFTIIASKRSELLKTGDALADVTKQAIILAEASQNVTVPEAAIALGNTLNQFNLSANESGRVINAFAATTQIGAVSIQFLTEALVKAGPIDRKFNIPLEDTLAVLNSLGKAGLQASVAGTGFASTLLKLAQDGRSQFNPEANTILELLSNIDKASLSTTDALDLFGLETFNVAGLMVDFNKQSKEMVEKITDTNTAYDQASIKAATYDGKLKSLGSAVEGLQLAIFARLEPSLVATVERFTELSRKAIELVEPVSGVVKILGQTGLVFAATAAGTALVGLAAKSIIATTALLGANVAAGSLITTLSFLGTSLFLGFKLGEFLGSEFKIARDAGAIFFNFVGKSVTQLVFGFKSLGAIIADAFISGFRISLLAIEKSLEVLGTAFSALGLDSISEKAFNATGTLNRLRTGDLGEGLGSKLLRFREERDTRLSNIDDSTISALRRDTDTVTVTLSNDSITRLSGALVPTPTQARQLFTLGTNQLGRGGTTSFVDTKPILINVVTNLDGQKVAESVVRTDAFGAAVADTRETLTRSVAR